MYTQTNSVNIKPKSYLPEFHVSQNDVGRTLTAHLVSDEGDISIPIGATVTMAGTKPSGLGYTVTGTIDGSDVSFDTDAVMTDEPGRIVSEIRIVQGDTVIGTTNVVLSVEPNPHPDDTTDGRREPLVNEITALLTQITEQADRVEEYSGKVLNMTVTAHESDEATVTKTEGEVVNLDFGLPRGPQGIQGIPGEDGEDGVTPDFTIGTVETLAPGEQATATITGTDEDPVLNLGIPQGAKGDKGDPGEVSLETLAKVMVSDTASGTIATFSDGSDALPAKSVLVTLNPKQSGSGTPSPDNIRPISGWDEVDVSVSAITPPDNKRKASDNLFDGEHNEIVQLHIPSGTAVCVSALGSGVGFRYYDADKVEIDYWALSTSAGDGRYYCSFVTIGAKDAEYVLFYGVERTDYMVETGVSSPSSYVPHGTTYTQDIEATYTPTVQENEPYQFKRTGDVGGDRESIELVGGTVGWNQLVRNGDFSNGTSGWTSTGGTLTANDNVGSLLATQRMGFANKTNMSAISGHKYITLADVKVSSGVVEMNCAWGSTYTTKVGVFETLGAIWQSEYTGGSLSHPRFYDMRGSDWDAVLIKNVHAYDLTAMFGSTIADYIYSLEQATAGAGVAWFKKLFPEPYYEYNAGELMSVNTSSHNTVGFNQWDEEWEVGDISASTGANTSSTSVIRTKNYIPIMPKTVYFAKFGTATGYAVRARFYDADKNYIGTSAYGGTQVQYNQPFTTPENAHYMRFTPQSAYGTTYNNDICINLSWDGERDGEYEPYVKHSYPLDSSLTLRGIPKLDASNNLYYDGDTYESDGTVTRKYGIVDLGTLNWSRNATNQFYAPLPTAGTQYTGNQICTKYQASARGAYNANGDKCVTVTGINCWVRDSAYDVTADFKASLNGVYLVYELATPTTETADSFEEIQICSPYGTEEFVDNRAVPIPVGNNTQYYTRDIYGGTLDLVSGVLTVDRAMVDLGTLTWSYWAQTKFFHVILSDVRANTTNAICDRYVRSDSGFNRFMFNGQQLRIYTEDYTDPEDFKTAVNGAQLVYELATPTTIQCDPQTVQTLIGDNNVWGGSGVSIDYYADTKLYIEKMLGA